MPGDDFARQLQQPDKSTKPVQTLEEEDLGDPRNKQPRLAEVSAKGKGIYNVW